MADETVATPTAPAATGPTFSLIAQYIRDLSFENPGAPTSILAAGQNPTFGVNINVSVKKQSDDIYAVEILLNAKASREATVLFNVELAYGGVFRLKNVPEPQLAPLLMIEAPRLIFPFARQVLANTVQNGGFPPLMMEPVNFEELYRQNLSNLAAQQKKEAEAAGDKPN